MSTTLTKLDLDQLCVTTMRTQAIDAIQRASSGHPGTPMGTSPTMYGLWQGLPRFDPADPTLFERFASRGEDNFAEKLLSAMGFQFGGYLEKAAGAK